MAINHEYVTLGMRIDRVKEKKEKDKADIANLKKIRRKDFA